MLGIFDIFKIGIGPSSSHTVGPMKAAAAFVEQLKAKQLLDKTERVRIDVHGSLALTGKGHHTDQGILLGLAGFDPETVDTRTIPKTLADIERHDGFFIKGKKKRLQFNLKAINFIPENLPLHENGLQFHAEANGKRLFSQTYYSIGGGFIKTAEAMKRQEEATRCESPFSFASAAELLEICQKKRLRICDLMLANELQNSCQKAIDARCLELWQVMEKAIHHGCQATEPLPGPLKLKRRAPALFADIKKTGQGQDPLHSVDWINLYAIAVSEENAAGGRIVTSPTNGSAGIIPAVLAYYNRFREPLTTEKIREFLMTAAAVGILFKINASISGAEVGCQGETGVSSAMAAAGLAELYGASPQKVTDAAEIAMEHHLGLTCDPVGGLVQIPCIERNAMSAMKAINAARMALVRETDPTVSLDTVINTMYETGRDMHSNYRETAKGGLAVNIMPSPSSLSDDTPDTGT